MEKQANVVLGTSRVYSAPLNVGKVVYNKTDKTTSAIIDFGVFGRKTLLLNKAKPTKRSNGTLLNCISLRQYVNSSDGAIRTIPFGTLYENVKEGADVYVGEFGLESFLNESTNKRDFKKDNAGFMLKFYKYPLEKREILGENLFCIGVATLSYFVVPIDVETLGKGKVSDKEIPL